VARVKLTLPDTFTFETVLDVRVTEINYGNHVGNDRMVSLLHEARLRFLRSYGFGEFNIAGLGIMVTDLMVEFKSESFVGENLKFEVGVNDFNKYGCDFIYRVSCADEGRLVTLAKTGIVFFDYDERKIARIPKKFTDLVLPKPADEEKNSE
jgi:acyl-CoA thioesterase FadM|tara:strand:+ start:373 stop:828 length:456 start_codon:yes stop_codon:yes gene_type:complete